MRPNHPRTYRAFVSALTLALVAGLSLSLAGPAQAKKRGLTNFDSLKGQIIPAIPAWAVPLPDAPEIGVHPFRPWLPLQLAGQRLGAR